MSTFISIVICTYNRADLLGDAIGSLCDQELDPMYYEVIVVDNNSTDNTRLVVEKFIERRPNVRYCLETEIGLSHARNRGWREARGEYVAYTDDDCKLPAQWLTVAQEIIDQVSPGVFGGPYFAFYNSPKPRWFKDAYESRDWGNEARPLRKDEFLIGNNIFFRRELLETMNGFDARLGMTGNQVAYGEESALQRQLRINKPEELFYYDPKLYVYHLVRPEKMTMLWKIRASIAKGRSNYILIYGHHAPPAGGRHLLLLRAIKVLLIFSRELIYGSLKRDRSQYPYIQNYLYECVLWRLGGLGRLYAQYHQLNQPQEVKLQS